MDKSQLRQSLQEKLRAIEVEEQVSRSKKACRNLIETPEFQGASVVMMYLAIPYEVDTADAILSAWQMGKVVAVPKVSWEQRHMIPVQIHTLETEPAWEGARLHNPVVGQPTALEEIDLVVTPGLGYDEKGNRLGRGGSYYDRFFASEELSASRCGLIFSEQHVESIPTDGHDEHVDFLVTDDKVTYFNNNRLCSKEGE